MSQLPKVSVIGAGAMGSAVIRGIISSGFLPPENIAAIDVDPHRLQELEDECGVKTSLDLSEGLRGGRVAVLAVKPQVCGELLPTLAEILDPATLLLSVVAGLSLTAMALHLKNHNRIVRCMPNMPALVGKGITAMAPVLGLGREDMVLAERIISSLGDVVVLEERLFDAVTALSGSGPAYVCLFVEALSDAGVKAGLPRKTAMKLALATLSGTAAVISEKDMHPAALKDMVASPGGTTIAGLEALETAGFRSAVYAAVAAAARRSAEMGK